MAKKRSETTEPLTAAANPIPAPAGTEAPKRRGRPPLENPKPRSPILMGIKARDDYREWFDTLTERLAREMGVGSIDRSLVFDRAVSDLAKSLGHPAPPRRI